MPEGPGKSLAVAGCSCIKRGLDGTVLKYKACLVAQGFTQIEGIDYDEMFTPVAKLALLHAIMALAAERDLKLHQMDVKSTYLNGELSRRSSWKRPQDSISQMAWSCVL